MPALGAISPRTRWLLGGGAVVVAVALVAGGLFILGSRSVPEALRYVPGDSLIVAEARLDLPGDQLANLGNLLSHFPGFKDQSTLATKLDQSLDQVIGGASGGALDYTTKLKPWLAGAAFVAVGPPPGSTIAPGGASSPPAPAASGAATAAGVAASDAVVVATTDGQVTCGAAIPNPGAGGDVDQGVEITTSSDGQMACGMDGRIALLGTPARVRAAIDARRSGTGMDRDATYAQARGQLTADELATVFVSGRAASIADSASALPIQLPGTGLGLPSWAIAGLRAEGDALVADLIVGPAGSAPGATSPALGSAAASAVPVPTLVTMPPPHTSVVAGQVPGNAILVAEAHGAGVEAQNALAALVADPALAGQAQQLQSALSLAGGPSGVLGWIDDAAVVLLPKPGDAAGGVPGVDGGLVLVASDDATATAKTGQLVSLLSLAALGGGGSATSEQIEGATVTNIDLGDLSTLLGQAGAAGNLGGVSIPSDLRVSLSIAARGRFVLIGTDETFATAILGADPGQTLASLPAYQRAMSHAANSNLGQVYLSGDGLRAFAGAAIPADEQARWQDLQPYVEPIESLVLTTTTGGGMSRTRIVASVATPAAPAAS